MEEGRGVLVEIQPDRMCYKGFENLARMGGRSYIAAGANKIVGKCYDDGEDGRLEILPTAGLSAQSRCPGATATRPTRTRGLLPARTRR